MTLNDAYGIGDVILVKMKVKEIGSTFLTVHPLACEGDPSQHIKVDAEDINSIFTAAIKVGDRVRSTGSIGGYGVVLAINEQQAWVRYENGKYSTDLLKNLKRAKAQYKEVVDTKKVVEEPSTYDLQEVIRIHSRLENGMCLRPESWPSGSIYQSSGKLYIVEPFEGKKRPTTIKQMFTLDNVVQLVSRYGHTFKIIEEDDNDDD